MNPLATPANTVRLAFEPRPHQAALYRELRRFNVLICHRRFGKTFLSLGYAASLALIYPDFNVAYLMPLRIQAKTVAWDVLKIIVAPIPGVLVNESELLVRFPNGSKITVAGADNYDALRGSGFDLCVCDEFAQMLPAAWTSVLRPALADRKGRAIFIGTPQGRNHFHALYEQATGPDWYRTIVPASQSGVLPESELDDLRRMLSPEEYQQELECSFNAAIAGSVYARDLSLAQLEGRISDKRLPISEGAPLYAALDLGIADPSSVWLIQPMSGMYVAVDSFEVQDLGLRNIVQTIIDRADHPDLRLILPHDVEQRDISSGRSRLDVIEALGVPYVVAERHLVEDGIAATREFLRHVVFDGVACREGIEHLQHYRYDLIEAKGTFARKPRHDHHSHAADSLRYAAAVLDRGDQFAFSKHDDGNSPHPVRRRVTVRGGFGSRTATLSYGRSSK